jgi:hypothetical protein
MLMTMNRSDSLIKLCVDCFRIIVQVLTFAVEKLRQWKEIAGMRSIETLQRYAQDLRHATSSPRIGTTCLPVPQKGL